MSLPGGFRCHAERSTIPCIATMNCRRDHGSDQNLSISSFDFASREMVISGGRSQKANCMRSLYFHGRGSSEAIGSRRLCLTDPCKNIADSSSTLIFRNLVINGLRPLLARNNNVCRITSSNNSRVSTASRAIPFGTWSRRLARLAFRNVRAKEGRIRRRQSMLPKLAAIETVFS